MKVETLKVRGVRARPVAAPMKRPLATSSGTVNVAPLLLIDLETDAGITGRSYLFAIVRVDEHRRRFRNLGKRHSPRIPGFPRRIRSTCRRDSRIEPAVRGPEGAFAPARCMIRVSHDEISPKGHAGPVPVDAAARDGTRIHGRRARCRC